MSPAGTSVLLVDVPSFNVPDEKKFPETLVAMFDTAKNARDMSENDRKKFLHVIAHDLKRCLAKNPTGKMTIDVQQSRVIAARVAHMYPHAVAVSGGEVRCVWFNQIMKGEIPMLYVPTFGFSYTNGLNFPGGGSPCLSFEVTFCTMHAI